MPSATFNATITELDELLGVGRSFDITRRAFLMGGVREAVFYTIAGFADNEVVAQLFEFFLKVDIKPEDDEKFIHQSKIPFGSVQLEHSMEQVFYRVSCGASAVIIDGMNGMIVIDARKYPGRNVSEPDTDRVLRGPRDGFVENIAFNAALVRRRVRDERLVMERITIGSATKTDIVLAYLDGKADVKVLNDIKKRLGGIKAEAISMGQESIAELILPQEWYNPFPKIRYTERPDSASASIMEGQIIVICDNYPGAMILPTSIFTFLQDTDDFYFSPVIGSYLKMVRIFTYLASLAIPPIWYIFAIHPDWLPGFVSFIGYNGDFAVPLIIQLFMFELLIDGLKLASLNTPSTLSNSLSLIGALLLGELAITVGLMAPQVILYMAFVTIANFAQPSYELGYAFKLMRMITLLLVFIFSLWGWAIWGLVGGVVITLGLIASTKTVGGRFAYLSPLIPWNGRAMARLWFRAKLKNK